MTIYNSEYMTWDSKKGNLTQATARGATLTDVITIPTTAALNIGDVIHLKNYKSSTVITNLVLTSSAIVRSVDVVVSVCLLRLDPITKEPLTFQYTAGGDDLLQNFSTSIDNGSANTDKKNAGFKLAATAANNVSLNTVSLIQGGTYRGQAKTDAGTYVDNANVNKVWRKLQGDETIGMVAEYAMSNMTDNAGVAQDKAADGYDPSARKGYTEFGLGLAIQGALTIAQLEGLGLKVIVQYKDTMLSETSYGLNYIPATVTY